MHRSFPDRGVVRALLLPALLSTCLTGCGDENPLAPFEPEVSNVADSFSLQATGVDGVTAALVYSWQNSGTRATINHSTSTSEGSTLLVIRDDAGTVVYSQALSPSLNEPTAAGQPGTWSIRLTLTGYSGTLNFLAQKL
jgi:hypothetical protein